MDLNALPRRHAVAAARIEHELLRLRSELDFARALVDLHPGEKAWPALLEEAFALAEAAAGTGELGAVQGAVGEAETLLAPLGRTAKTYTIHCVGHAHLDMNWMWSWPETVAAAVDTVRTVLRLLDEFPSFRFSQSQASIYRILEQYAPDLLDRVRARVAEGRWEVTASAWVEGEKNFVSGESLCRHLLITRRYMKTLFNLKPEAVPIDWSPDTFGHAATIPTCLAAGGVRFYYGHRFGLHADRPPLFRWRGPDGSEVIVRNDTGLGYNGQIDPGAALRLPAFAKATGLRDMMFVYGIGDHGGGPTRRDILRGLDMDGWPIFPNLRFSTAGAFFAIAEKSKAKLPVLDGELNFEFTGCYTTQALIKRSVRHAETQLAAAETAAVLGWRALGRPYPHEAFEECWRDTLFNHFHDILPGSCVHDSRTYSHGLFQKTAAATGQIETAALRALAGAVDTSGFAGPEEADLPADALRTSLGAGVGFGTGNGLPSQANGSTGGGLRPLLLFNPAAAPRTGVTLATVWDNDPRFAIFDPNTAASLRGRKFSVTSATGRKVGAQVVDAGAYWGHAFATLAFPIEELAPLGYAVCAVTEEESPAEAGVRVTGLTHNCPYSLPETSRFGMENGLLALGIDPASGGLASLKDLVSGRELLDPTRPCALLDYALERPHGMTAWHLADTTKPEPLRAVSVERKQMGPHVASIEVKVRRDDNQFTLRYELRAGDPCLYLSIDGTWVERGSPERGVPVLRLDLPFALQGAKARYEIPFGAIDRDLNAGEEVPAVRWAQVTGETAQGTGGCWVGVDCKHGWSLTGDRLRLTLIRSSYDPDPIPEIGQHPVRMALRPFAGDLAPAEAIRLADALAQPVRAIGTDAHPGRLPTTGAPLTLAPAGLVLIGLKKAEDAAELVLRVAETAGRKCEAKITLDPRLLGAPVKATLCDLMERPIKDAAVKIEGNRIRFAVPARGIATVRVKCK